MGAGTRPLNPQHVAWHQKVFVGNLEDNSLASRKWIFWYKSHLVSNNEKIYNISYRLKINPPTWKVIQWTVINFRNVK